MVKTITIRIDLNDGGYRLVLSDGRTDGATYPQFNLAWEAAEVIEQALAINGTRVIVACSDALNTAIMEIAGQ